MTDLDLKRWGVGAWLNPADAIAASVDEQKKLLAGIIATRLQVQREWLTSDRGKRREQERFLTDLNATMVGLMALLRAEREV